jgi:hypothetical protein
VDVEVISLPDHSVVTAWTGVGEGGSYPFTVVKVEILDGDCRVLATISPGSSGPGNQTIVIGPDLGVSARAGGDARAGASSSVTTQCPLLVPSPSS